MIKLGIVSCRIGTTAVLLSLFAISVTAATESPDFKEVYDLVRTHVPGLSSEELNKAAVDGLIQDLKPRVSLVGDEGQGTPTEPSVAKATLLDKEIAYLRVKRVDDSLA